jgi:hypothetical protein
VNVERWSLYDPRWSADMKRDDKGAYVKYTAALAAVAQARREGVEAALAVAAHECAEWGKARDVSDKQRVRIGVLCRALRGVEAGILNLLAAAPGGGQGEVDAVRVGGQESPATKVKTDSAASSPPAPVDIRYEPYYVCAECDEDTSGHAAADLRVRPDGDLICECCCDALDDECPRWEDLPAFCPSAPPATSRVEDRDARVARGAEALIRHSCRAWNFNQACEMARMILAAAEAAPTPAHSRIDALRAAWITAEEQRCCCPAGEHALYVRLCAVAREAWQDYIEARDANEGRMP